MEKTTTIKQNPRTNWVSDKLNTKKVTRGQNAGDKMIAPVTSDYFIENKP